MRRTNLKPLRIWGCYLQGSRPRDQSGCRRQQQGVTAQKNPPVRWKILSHEACLSVKWSSQGSTSTPVTHEQASLAGASYMNHWCSTHVSSLPLPRGAEIENSFTRVWLPPLFLQLSLAALGELCKRDPQTPVQPQGQQWNSGEFISQLTFKEP